MASAAVILRTWSTVLDFQKPKATWSEKLIELSLDGIELNVGVRTGSASGLLVIEVQKQGRVFPFRRGDWSSECVAEAGAQFEQHYYALPEGWQLPASFLLEPFEVKVFGEGNLVMAPPSLEPRTQANWRWLKPPWDSAPNQPPPVLRKIIESMAPDPDSSLSAPIIPSWEEIYPAIAAHPTVLQALMNPASSPESYYQHLLAAARAIGLNEPHLLLGLCGMPLWGMPGSGLRDGSIFSNCSMEGSWQNGFREGVFKMMSPVSLPPPGSESGPLPRNPCSALNRATVPRRWRKILAAGSYPGILPYHWNGPVRTNLRRAANRAARIMARVNLTIAGRNLSGLLRKT